MIVLLAVLAEFFFGLGFNHRYIENILSVPKDSLINLFRPRALAYKLLDDAWVYLACVGALLATFVAGRRSIFFDWAYVFGSIVGSVVLLELTGGATRGLPALIAVFVCCGELARREELKKKVAGWRHHIGSLACLFLALMFVFDPVAMRVVGWSEYHTGRMCSNRCRAYQLRYQGFWCEKRSGTSKIFLSMMRKLANFFHFSRDPVSLVVKT